MSHETVPAKYRDTLENAEENHMTDDYDSAFAKVKELRWYPWVGKNYNNGRILILGMSTYYKKEKKWTNDWIDLCNSINPSRVLVAQGIESTHGERTKDRRPYEAMSKMFANAKDKHYGRRAEIFWKSVAFNNYCQKVVLNVSGKCLNEEEYNSHAFHETLSILKPKLCLVWGVGLTDKLGFKRDVCRDCKIGIAYPRVIETDGNRPPIIGLGHPSRGFSPPDWRKFLLTNKASKQPTTDFIAYLQSQPVE